VPLLVGIDLVGRPKPHLRPYVADVRWPALRPGSLDAVLAISVLEHIGRDNACYPTPYADPSSTEGDQQAIRALAAALRPGGRLILSVPYGLAEDHGWFVQFDRARLERLVATSGLALGGLEHFRYHDGWQGPVDPAGLKGVRYGVGSVAAGAVACAVLVRGAA
jgi:SAM-dependent methyltransferase